MSDYVYVGGTFDLFHSGHVTFLRRVAAFGPVVVLLNTDEFAERYKRRPIMDLGERLAVVEACKYVKEVDVNVEGEDSRESILRWRPKYIAHGDDWQRDGLLKQLGISESFLTEFGIKMMYLPYTAGVSTSDLIERCRA